MLKRDEAAETINRLDTFKSALREHEKTGNPKLREWLNQEVGWVKSEVIEAGCFFSLTISPPPAIGGLVLRNVDPFAMMFERPYLMSFVPTICDMVDKTIGVLRNPPKPTTKTISPAAIKVEINSNYAFVAMPMDKDDHQLVDVLETIKDAAQKCGMVAERVDDTEFNERITDRILKSIDRAEYVIVDLTKERPNVFFEAGYAQGCGKIPIFVAREGTHLHFDIKDYPIIIFRNMKELKEGLVKRLIALSKSRNEQRLPSGLSEPTGKTTGEIELYPSNGHQSQRSSELQDEPTAVIPASTPSSFAVGQRVFHHKFGYGRINEIEGVKLTVAFEKFGVKRVVTSFIEAA